ncbi:Kelch repeat-containing protein [Microlunatus parietis]|uniref:Galactose oxidase, central domain n=1 Tax=Microlunatus parietis TaxID=682979 RepID=A0A7Y9I5E2_9ACTN|nr:hypothetical protein [Microlunatus parietis]NYE70610.1 hypothetical protein [Microlunatus parietis]
MVTRRQFGAALLGAALLPGCARPVAVEPGRKPTPIGEWVPIPDPPLEPRYDAVGGWLAGRFVITGGQSTLPCPPGANCQPPKVPALRDGAAFDPATGRWERLPDAPTPISNPYRTAVVGDRLYVLTLNNGQPDSPDAMLAYDAGPGAWSTLPLPPVTEVGLVGVEPTGLIAIGGSDERGAVADHRFDPEAGRWVRLPDDPLGPSFDRAGVWLGDRLLLTAMDLVDSPGSERPSLVRLATWDPSSDRWALGPDTELIGGGALRVGDRVVWPMTGSADGGKVNNWGRHYPYGGILDPATGGWTALPDPPAGDGLGGALLTVDGLITVGGHLLEPVSRHWTRIPESPMIDRVGATVIGGVGTILAWGGSDHKINFADGRLLRLT